MTSYDGDVFFGLTADRDAVSDLDVLVQCLDDALGELLDTTVRGARRQPTRKASPAARRRGAQGGARERQAAERPTGQKRAAVRKLASTAGTLGAATLRPAGKRPAKQGGTRHGARRGGEDVP